MKLIECVPNFSEGRRPEVVAAIRDAIAAVPGAHLLDASSDASHNRSVITFVSDIAVVADAAFAGIREAARQIDLTQHSGEHPQVRPRGLCSRRTTARAMQVRLRSRRAGCPA